MVEHTHTLTDHFNSLQQQHTSTLQTVQEQSTLIKQLESDLSLVQPYIPVREEGEVQAAPPTSADIISEALKDVQVERKSAGEVRGADSLLPIVSSQRERFKQRNLELEAVS